MKQGARGEALIWIHILVAVVLLNLFGFGLTTLVPPFVQMAVALDLELPSSLRVFLSIGEVSRTWGLLVVLIASGGFVWRLVRNPDRRLLIAITYVLDGLLFVGLVWFCAVVVMFAQNDLRPLVNVR